MSQLIFLLLLSTGIFFFARRIRFIQRNIRSGRDVDLSDQKGKRWKTMARVALGQSKMTARPVAGAMHILIYLGFVIINVEILEILLDGLLGTHRIFAEPLGAVYHVLIGSFEWLAAGVILACVVFFMRRNAMAIARLRSRELAGWPSLDANIILVVEVLLMFAFLSMNATDGIAQSRGLEGYVNAGSFPISQWLMPLYVGLSDTGIVAVERGMWWFHIAGVLAFLVYVPYSKHFHIMLAFPNTYFSDLTPTGAMNNMASVTREVQLMMDPTADPYAAPSATEEVPAPFGAQNAAGALPSAQRIRPGSCSALGRS